MSDNKLRKLEKNWEESKTAESALALARELARSGQGEAEFYYIIQNSKGEYYSGHKYDYQRYSSGKLHNFTDKFKSAKRLTKNKVYELLTTNYKEPLNKDAFKNCKVLECVQIVIVGNSIDEVEITKAHTLKMAQKEKSSAERRLKALAVEEANLRKEIEDRKKFLEKAIEKNEQILNDEPASTGKQ